MVIVGKHLEGTLPPEMGRFQNLKELLLHENDLFGKLSSELGKLTSLTNFLSAPTLLVDHLLSLHNWPC
jgi:hypothetical protein